MLLTYPKKFALIAVIISLLAGSVDVASGQHPITGKADSLNTNRLRTFIVATSAFYAGGLYFLNEVWYKNHRPVPFHFYNDWPGWMQVDKTGHMYTAYYQSKTGIEALRWAGVSDKRAIWVGGSMGIVMQTPIEIFDGLYEGHGFSVTDMIANAAGTVLVVGQELLWQEQRIRMKFSYYPTRYAGYRPSYFGKSRVTNFFTDYNGHTYWLSANLFSFLPGSKLPGWLNIAIGYGADGMLGEFENPQYYKQAPLPDFDRTRQLYLSIDLNLEAIQTRSKFIRGLLGVINMVKIPAPSIELNSSRGIVLHPIYF